MVCYVCGDIYGGVQMKQNGMYISIEWCNDPRWGKCVGGCCVCVVLVLLLLLVPKNREQMTNEHLVM